MRKLRTLEITIVIVALLTMIGFGILYQTIENDNYDHYKDQKTVLIDTTFQFDYEIIAKSWIESKKTDSCINYYYCIKYDSTQVKFTFSDIRDLIHVIKKFDKYNENSEFELENNFLIGRTSYKYNDKWYISLNTDTCKKLYIIKNIRVFEESLTSAAVVLVSYMYYAEKDRIE